jgi:hypothetical protein
LRRRDPRGPDPLNLLFTHILFSDEHGRGQL